jgi:hypothetical protein
MAIASTGDREKILNQIDQSFFKSDLVGACFRAIRSREEEDIASLKDAFSFWGIEVGDGKLIDGLIRKFKSEAAKSVLESAYRDAIAGDLDEQAIEIYRRKTDELFTSLVTELGEYS